MKSTRKLIPHRIIPNDLYVEREADRQLESILADMASPGYVLVSRQMGKTNLLLNAKRTYQNPLSDVYTYIDLSNSFSNEVECFRHIIDKSIDTHQNLLSGLAKKIEDIRAKALPPHLEHLSELRTILNHIDGKIVIILDEIDALTRANFSDKIFSQIRSIYFERDSYPELNNLTYILSGVVEPTEIIQDSKISPFNIGQKIFLDDFSIEEHRQFLEKADLALEEKLSERIYYWTSGNPRITYDISSEIERLLLSNKEVSCEAIDNIVKEIYLTNFDKAPVDHIRELVENDKTIRDAMTIIRYGKGNQLDHSTKTKLYLSGIIGSNFNSSTLGIKNRIIDASLSDIWLKSIDNKNKSNTNLIISALLEEDYKKVISIYESVDQSTEFLDNSTFYNAGISYFKSGNYTKAISALEKIDYDITYKKSDALESRFLLAESFMYNDNPEKAVELYEEIIKIDAKEKFYYLSISPLGNIYIDYNKGEMIAKALEFFDEILEKQDYLEKKYPGNFESDFFAATHLHYGRALSKLKDESGAKNQYNLAFQSARGYIRPVILLGQYNLEREHSEKIAILNQVIDTIISEELFPDPSSDNFTYFSNNVVYNILKTTESTIPNRFAELCHHFLSHKKNLLNDDYGDILLNIAFESAAKTNMDLAVKILAHLVSDINFSKLSPELTYAALRFLVANTEDKITDDILIAEKFLTFLIKNKKYRITFLELDKILSIVDRKINEKHYDRITPVIESLYTSLDSAGDEQKNSKILLELLEIKVLETCDFVDAAQIRSKSLLANINALTSEDLEINPLLKNSIDGVKSYLTSVNLPGLAKIPTRVYVDNERVSVRYVSSNRVLTKVKYKKVKQDIRDGICVII